VQLSGDRRLHPLAVGAREVLVQLVDLHPADGRRGVVVEVDHKVYQPAVSKTTQVGEVTFDPPDFKNKQDPKCPPLKACRYSDSAFVKLDNPDDGMLLRNSGLPRQFLSSEVSVRDLGANMVPEPFLNSLDVHRHSARAFGSLENP
jgi:hypothetical protein